MTQQEAEERERENVQWDEVTRLRDRRKTDAQYVVKFLRPPKSYGHGCIQRLYEHPE